MYGSGLLPVGEFELLGRFACVDADVWGLRGSGLKVGKGLQGKWQQMEKLKRQCL